MHKEGSPELARQKIIEVEELRRESEKLENILSEVHEDNALLQTDIDRYKDTVRTLNQQNEELVAELERITDKQEDIRSLMHRRDRIETLLARAEVTMQSYKPKPKY